MNPDSGKWKAAGEAAESRLIAAGKVTARFDARISPARSIMLAQTRCQCKHSDILCGNYPSNGGNLPLHRTQTHLLYTIRLHIAIVYPKNFT